MTVSQLIFHFYIFFPENFICSAISTNIKIPRPLYCWLVTTSYFIIALTIENITIDYNFRIIKIT